MRFCGFWGLVWRGVGTGRGEFLFGIGMIEPGVASGDTVTATDSNGRPWMRRLADEEASDCTVAVDGRVQNSAGGMSKEDTLDHARAGETCPATKKHIRTSGNIFTRITTSGACPPFTQAPTKFTWINTLRACPTAINQLQSHHVVASPERQEGFQRLGV